MKSQRTHGCAHSDYSEIYQKLNVSVVLAGTFTSAYLNVGVWIYLAYISRRVTGETIAITSMCDRRSPQNRKFYANRLLLYTNLMDFIKIISLFWSFAFDDNSYPLIYGLTVFILYFMQSINFFFLLAFHLNFRLQFFTYVRKVKWFIFKNFIISRLLKLFIFVI